MIYSANETRCEIPEHRTYNVPMESPGQTKRRFAKRLRHYRKKAGFSKAAPFAREVNIERGTYSTYETGRALPRYDNLMRMCSRLGITPDDLFLPDREPVSESA